MADSTEPDPLATLRIKRIDLRSFLPAPLADRWLAEPGSAARREVIASLSNLLRTLTTYLPRHLLFDVMTQPEAGRARGAFLTSTVLFADLSGFTAMSERLTGLGREGAETLTTVVNDYFTAMSGIAARHGGDLMLFGGDAMLLLFDGIDHALRACHAAWQMQQAMRDRFAEVQTARGTFPLRMAAGLASGEVFAASLGSTASMHYTVMGPALAEMGRAEALAGGGRIILNSATQLLAGEIQIEAEGEAGFARLIAEPGGPFKRPDPPLLELPPDDESERLDWLAQRLSAIAPFLPPGLLPRLLPDPAAALEGEHRPVTVLFIDFHGADALIDLLGADDPNAITPRLNAAFDVARAVVARYEGVINKISTGPAGSHLIALFGAPTSHEDDPARAVQAALEIRSALARSDLPGAHSPRIGINTGFVYAANVGSSARREYTVMGDQVNLAARLMTAAAPGDIIVSASTAQHVQRVVDLQERAPVTVKGKAQPQRNFVVRGARARSAMPQAAAGRLAGRAGLTAIGHDRLQSARQRRGQIIAVGGEAGAGKSRLIESLAAQARAEGFDVIAGACASYGRAIPYSTWLEPLRALIDLQPPDNDADRRAKLQTALAAIDRGADAPIVAEIIGVPLAETTWTSALDAQARQRRLFDAVTELIRRRSDRRPLMWIIDDAHWIDPASLDLLDHLARRIDDASVALIVSYRPEGKWAGWDGLPNAMEMAVLPLDRASIESVVADLLDLDDRRLPLSIQTLLQRMAAGVLSAAPADAEAFERYWGNPFFAQERIRALIDSGALARDAAGQWQVTKPIESIEMPDTIHGVIMSRIDRLPEPARRALQVASVVGRAIDLRLLRAVYDSPGETFASLRRHLDDLRDLGLTPLEGEAERARYVFRNVTTQEVAYDSLRYERRRELHRRIGEQIETQPILVDDASGLLAHHFFEGQVWGKALTYALETGWRAQQQYANAAAAGAYRRALQAAESLDPPRVMEQLAALEALGDVLSITGEYDEAQRHYARARDLAADDPRHLSDLFRKTAETFEKRSAFEEAFASLNRGLEFAAPDSLEAARLYLMGAGLFYRQGRHDQSAEWCRKCLSISHALPETRARAAEARAQYLLAETYRERGDLSQAIESAQRALSVYLLSGDVAGQSQALNTLANTYADQGDFAQATRCYDDSLQFKQRIGDVAGQAVLMVNLGELHRTRGDLAEARRMFKNGLDIFRELGNTWAVALLHNNLAAVAVVEQDWTQAADHLADSERLFAEVGSDDFKGELLRHRAELELGQGRIDAGIDHAQQAVSMAQAGQEKLELGLSRRVLGEAFAAQDRLVDAERELQASLEMLESIGSTVESATTRVGLARLRRRQNRPDDARQLIDHAVAAYDSIGAQALKQRALAI